MTLYAADTGRTLDQTIRAVVKRESIHANVVVADNGCWMWQGPFANAGYASMYVSGIGTSKPAYRVTYMLWVGAIPEGYDIDHLCRTPACVNPEHLEAVTHRENILRGNTFAARNVAKTHCPQGHPYDEENTYWELGRKRKCKECVRAGNRRARAKRKAATRG